MGYNILMTISFSHRNLYGTEQPRAALLSMRVEIIPLELCPLRT